MVPAAVAGNIVAVLLVGLAFLLMPQDSIYRLLGALLGWMTQAPPTEDMAENFVLEPIRSYLIVMFAANTAPNFRRTTAIVVAALYFGVSAFAFGLYWPTISRVFSGGYWGLVAYLVLEYGLVILALVLAVRHVAKGHNETSFLTAAAAPET